ncbi:MAG TPA: NUDIX hydrolase [Patescibacteria group bacterium]|nr:NUDIX hydrolase [Patescibacteria group bacterium]
MAHAGIVLINKRGEVLMQHRDNVSGIINPDYWAYIAGQREEENENYEQTARRELQEETGYIVDKLYPLLEEDYKRTDGIKTRRHIFWAVYDGTQKINCFEGQEMVFLKLEELENKKILPDHKRICHLAVLEAKKKGLI